MPADASVATPQSARKWRLGFWSLIVTQFQGAFNDNGLKFLVIYMILAIVEDKNRRDDLQFLVGGLFAATFIIFAIIALARHNLPLALAAVFLISMQSAFFGPSKYGLLPEILPEARLSWGNGILELGTFLAIIISTFGGAYLADAFHGREAYAGIFFLACTTIGLVSSFGISRVPAAAPERKFQLSAIVNIWSPLRLMRGDKALWLAFLGNTYFFFLAAILQYNILVYGQDTLHITATRGGFLQAAVALGIGLGSVAAGFLSGGKIEYGLIPLCSLRLVSPAAFSSCPLAPFSSIVHRTTKRARCSPRSTGSPGSASARLPPF